jgi:hypothetical protein
MPNEAQMAWYTKQKPEDERLALSRLEQLLSEKKLTELEDFNEDTASRIYSLLTRIAAEKRIEYVFMAELVRDFYAEQLEGPCFVSPVAIAERAVARFKTENIQKMYGLDQPCV